MKQFNSAATTGIIFSKDRALQLDGVLRSFFRHCQDSNNINIQIIYTGSNDFFAEQYQELKREYHSCDFIREKNFKTDLLSALKDYEFILFLVDDNIFTHGFTLSEMTRQLRKNLDVLAFSLRLGRNTKKCYMVNREQTLPDFTATINDHLHFNWTEAEGDFGFPLEVSSSIYRVCDLLPLLRRLNFRDPNTLEHHLSQHKDIYSKIAPKLACFQESVTFCNPANIVNTSCICRSGNRQEYTSLKLAELFRKKLRIKVAEYDGFQPDACHQEIEFEFFRPPAPQPQALLDKAINSAGDELEKTLLLRQTFIKMGAMENAKNVLAKYLAGHPEDQDLISAINNWNRSANKNRIDKIPDISVIIPAYNCADTIKKSIDSVIQSFTFCKTVTGEFTSEIIVVNDCSSDNTGLVLDKYHHSSAVNLRAIHNRQNSGAGRSRNLGVKNSIGDLILFLDSDDIFHREHIFLCLQKLVEKPCLHFVQTGIHIEENILPYWKNAIENSVPFNLCVRRWCHDILEGYPEEREFTHGEDVFYRLLLTRYFSGFKLKRETMQHFRYPGNSLDRQMEKFSQPPNETTRIETLTESKQKASPLMQKIMADKKLRIDTRLKSWFDHLTTTP